MIVEGCEIMKGVGNTPFGSIDNEVTPILISSALAVEKVLLLATIILKFSEWYENIAKFTEC